MITMDDEEILAMEPGEEMNKMVAEKLMDGVSGDYSQDVSSSWKVVKRLCEMGWRMDIMSSKKEENVGGIKMVNGTPVSLNFLAERVKCDSLPEAVCKAALLIKNNSHRIEDIVSDTGQRSI